MLSFKVWLQVVEPVVSRGSFVPKLFCVHADTRRHSRVPRLRDLVIDRNKHARSCRYHSEWKKENVGKRQLLQLIVTTGSPKHES
jgi:hypothetical protein